MVTCGRTNENFVKIKSRKLAFPTMSSSAEPAIETEQCIRLTSARFCQSSSAHAQWHISHIWASSGLCSRMLSKMFPWPNNVDFERRFYSFCFDFIAFYKLSIMIRHKLCLGVRYSLGTNVCLWTQSVKVNFTIFSIHVSCPAFCSFSALNSFYVGGCYSRSFHVTIAIGTTLNRHLLPYCSSELRYCYPKVRDSFWGKMNRVTHLKLYSA